MVFGMMSTQQVRGAGTDAKLLSGLGKATSQTLIVAQAEIVIAGKIE